MDAVAPAAPDAPPPADAKPGAAPPEPPADATEPVDPEAARTAVVGSALVLLNAVFAELPVDPKTLTITWDADGASIAVTSASGDPPIDLAMKNDEIAAVLAAADGEDES